MNGFLLALAAAYGVFLVYTGTILGWAGLGIGPGGTGNVASRRSLRAIVVEAGLGDVGLAELIAAALVLAGVGGALGFALFGGLLPALFVAAASAWLPVASARARRTARMREAQEAWPRMLEEIRLQVTSMGRSVPQALLDVGMRGPRELRPAFAGAQREWLISTDFEQSLETLKAGLADATADAVCETLLIAHEIAGTDLDRRLAALIDDRVQDLQGRKDAVAKQAGARFARWFVIVVPAGMALAGLSIGDGRAAYQTGAGQLAVAFGLLLMGLCWAWAGRIMRLPADDRVFES